MTLAPSVLWITLSLAGMVVLNRSFMLEREHQALDGILLSPINRVAIYWGKWLANLALVTLVTLVAFPVWIVFFNVEPTGALWSVLAVAILAAAGFCAVGTLFAAMTARTRNGELLLPVLLLPFLIPPVFAGVQVTVRLLGGRPAGELFGWIRIVVIFDLVFLMLASWLFTEVVDE